MITYKVASLPHPKLQTVLPLLLQNILSSDWAVHSMGPKVQEVSTSVFELELTPVPALFTPHRDC